VAFHRGLKAWSEIEIEIGDQPRRLGLDWEVIGWEGRVGKKEGRWGMGLGWGGWMDGTLYDVQ
jgi:hypothetical protein